jgi:predicted alpha/beta hydrolase family esterase
MQNVPQRCVIHGDDDPKVPYEDAILLSEALDCKLITIPGGGHLTKKTECFELPEARDAVLKMMGIL